MKPYSLEFRQKIIDAYFEEKESIRKTARRFQVSKSFVQKLIKQYRETGTIAPKAHRGARTPKLNSEQRNLVAELVEQNNKATLQELCDIVENKTGVKVSRSTMSRIIRKLNE